MYKFENLYLTKSVYYDRIVVADTVGRYGEMSEWFKELVLKTSDTARYQAFESLTRRQHVVSRTTTWTELRVPLRYGVAITRRLFGRNRPHEGGAHKMRPEDI